MIEHQKPTSPEDHGSSHRPTSSQVALAIIGSGPAALSAAIYAGRAGVPATIFEARMLGGTLNEISHIDNYPGFTGTGTELAQAMRDQAAAVGTDFQLGACTDLQRAGKYFRLTIDDERSVAAHAVIIATGATPRRPDFPIHIPVSYCVLCDAPMAAGKSVVVLGGGNAAAQETLYLAPLVRHLTLVTHSRLKADPWLVERLGRLPNLTLLEDTEPDAALVDQFDYCFVLIGRRPTTPFLQRLADNTRNFHAEQFESAARPADLLDSTGYVIAPDTMTAIPGLYAAGDVRAESTHQIITAAADGANAALRAAAFLRQNPHVFPQNPL